MRHMLGFPPTRHHFFGFPALCRKLNLRIKTKPVPDGTDATVYVWLSDSEARHIPLICSNGDRLGVYAEIQIIFVTVHALATSSHFQSSLF